MHINIVAVFLTLNKGQIECQDGRAVKEATMAWLVVYFKNLFVE